MACFDRLTRLFGALVALRMSERNVTPSQLTQQVRSVNYYTLLRICAGHRRMIHTSRRCAGLPMPWTSSYTCYWEAMRVQSRCRNSRRAPSKL